VSRGVSVVSTREGAVEAALVVGTQIRGLEQVVDEGCPSGVGIRPAEAWADEARFLSSARVLPAEDSAMGSVGPAP
jgi:hypothetical protein